MHETRYRDTSRAVKLQYFVRAKWRHMVPASPLSYAFDHRHLQQDSAWKDRYAYLNPDQHRTLRHQ